MNRSAIASLSYFTWRTFGEVVDANALLGYLEPKQRKELHGEIKHLLQYILLHYFPELEMIDFVHSCNESRSHYLA
jgi:hypothetical protein